MLEAMGQLVVDVLVDPSQHPLLEPFHEIADEHEDHRQEQGERGGVERLGQAVGDAAERVFEDLGRDAGDGAGDAEHRAEEADDRNGPSNESQKGVAAFKRDGVVVGEAADLIVEIVMLPRQATKSRIAPMRRPSTVRRAPGDCRAICCCSLPISATGTGLPSHCGNGGLAHAARSRIQRRSLPPSSVIAQQNITTAVCWTWKRV